MLPIQRKISPYNHYEGNNIRYIVIHYVGATGTAKNNVDYFYGGDRQASAHYFVDDNSIWQSVEDYNGSWAVGNTRTEVNNKNSINIEMCCPNPQLYVSDKTINNTCELVVYLMKKYNIPLANVRTHYEVTAGAKLCPNFANTSRWTNMKNKIGQMLNGKPQQATTVQTSGEMYRVRKSWADASSQIGAYSNKENAIKSCPSGYKVFDSKGNQIHPATTTTQTNGDLCRIIVNGVSKIALTGLEKCKEYVKANYPKEKVEIQRVSDGKILFTQAKYVAPKPTYTSYKENGIFTFNTAVQIRNSTNLNDTTGICYYAGEEVTYDTVILNCNGFNWIVYTRSNGKRGYLKIKDLATGEKYGVAR